MPTYDYKCKECGNMFEVFRRFSELDEQVNCPNCGSEKTERWVEKWVQGEVYAEEEDQIEDGLIKVHPTAGSLRDEKINQKAISTID